MGAGQHIVVVFPAPLGPINPVAHPCSTTRSIGPSSKRGKLFFTSINSKAGMFPPWDTLHEVMVDCCLALSGISTNARRFAVPDIPSATAVCTMGPNASLSRSNANR